MERAETKGGPTDYETAQMLAGWGQPGLYYVHRDGQTVSLFDGPNFPQFDRPERDVAAALLRYALDRITEPRMELTRGSVP